MRPHTKEKYVMKPIYLLLFIQPNYCPFVLKDVVCCEQYIILQ